MWTFNYETRAGDVFYASDSEYAGISKKRRVILFKKPPCSLAASDDVLFIGPIKCEECGSFYLPEGLNGPDCNCD